jgi:hypothetical protein
MTTLSSIRFAQGAGTLLAVIFCIGALYYNTSPPTPAPLTQLWGMIGLAIGLALAPITPLVKYLREQQARIDELERQLQRLTPPGQHG